MPVKVYHDIPYVEQNHHKQLLDIYRPIHKNQQQHHNQHHHPTLDPVILFVHGGGWKRGDRRMKDRLFIKNLYQNVGFTFAEQNFVCVNISYRLSALSKVDLILLLLSFCSFLMTVVFGLCGTLHLSGVYEGIIWNVLDYLHYVIFVILVLGCMFVARVSSEQGENTVRHPDHVMDVTTAYKWVIQNIHNYGGDPKCIFLMGHSAGGHLVTLLSLDRTYTSQLDVPLSPIKGVVGLSGVYNLGRLKKMWLARWWYLTPLFGNVSRSEWRDVLHSASPLSYVHKTTFNFLLVTAKFDMHLPKDADELKEALMRGGVDVERYNVKGSHLNSVTEIGSKHDTLTPVILVWMRRQLRGYRG